jgi:hypothetical protein
VCVALTLEMGSVPGWRVCASGCWFLLSSLVEQLLGFRRRAVLWAGGWLCDSGTADGDGDGDGDWDAGIELLGFD